MTTLADRVPLEQISREARQVRFGRILLTLIAAVFFGLGWAAGRVFYGLAWCGVAVRVGWQSGRQAGGAHGGPARTDR